MRNIRRGQAQHPCSSLAVEACSELRLHAAALRYRSGSGTVYRVEGNLHPWSSLISFSMSGGFSMRTWLAEVVSRGWRFARIGAAAVAAVVTLGTSAALAQPASE